MSNEEEIGPLPDAINEETPVGSRETVEFNSGYGAELELLLPEDVVSTG